MNILEVKDLDMSYSTIDGDVEAVKNVSFSVKEGESFGIVGESGCGKTSVAMSLLQLQADNGKIVNGEIFFDGKESCALIPSEATNILPSTSNLFNSTNKKFLNMSKFFIKWYL